jgi:hypothetical protein
LSLIESMYMRLLGAVLLALMATWPVMAADPNVPPPVPKPTDKFLSDITTGGRVAPDALPFVPGLPAGTEWMGNCGDYKNADSIHAHCLFSTRRMQEPRQSEVSRDCLRKCMRELGDISYEPADHPHRSPMPVISPGIARGK